MPTSDEERHLLISADEHDAHDHTGVPGVGGGGGSDPNALPAATPFTTTTMPNPIRNGDMTVMVLSEDNPVFAIALEGDEFARIVIAADASDQFVSLSDGTVAFGAAISYDSSGVDPGLHLDGNAFVGPNVVVTVGDLVIRRLGFGVVLHSPDNTRYRIKVADDGTLSTEVVT